MRAAEIELLSDQLTTISDEADKGVVAILREVDIGRIGFDCAELDQGNKALVVDEQAGVGDQLGKLLYVEGQFGWMMHKGVPASEVTLAVKGRSDDVYKTRVGREVGSDLEPERIGELSHMVSLYNA